MLSAITDGTIDQHTRIAVVGQGKMDVQDLLRKMAARSEYIFPDQKSFKSERDVTLAILTDAALTPQWTSELSATLPFVSLREALTSSALQTLDEEDTDLAAMLALAAEAVEPAAWGGGRDCRLDPLHLSLRTTPRRRSPFSWRASALD